LIFIRALTASVGPLDTPADVEMGEQLSAPALDSGCGNQASLSNPSLTDH
jgi:hypothetical protein